MAKKAAGKAKSVAGKTGAKKATSHPEFLLIKVAGSLKPGGAVMLLGVADSLEKAKQMATDLPDTAIRQVAILEKKTVVDRKPAIQIATVSVKLVETPDADKAADQ